MNKVDEEKPIGGYQRKRRRPNKASGDKEKRYTCDICSSTFFHATNLNSHIKVVHKGIRPHACPQCDKRFPNAFSLKRHSLSHSGMARQWFCTTWTRFLISFVITQLGEKSHTCDICNKLFISATNLSIHKKTVHEGVRSFACDQCDKSFIHSYLLEQHKEAIHQGIRSNICKICDKSFSKASGLRRHLLAHTGRYNCNNFIAVSNAKYIFSKTSFDFMPQESDRLRVTNAINHSREHPF